MQEVFFEYKGVNGGEDSVDLFGGDEQSLFLFDDIFIVYIYLVIEERFVLIGRGYLGFVQRQVGLGGFY